MANRLTKIVTKTGDTGTTALADGKRCAKDAAIIHAIGEIDELNSSIGLARVVCQNTQLDAELKQIQQNLLNCGGDLCLTGSVLLNAKQLQQLEKQLNAHNQQIKPLNDFILPAGSELTVRLHMARSICRRAERALVTAKQESEFNPTLLAYINRLSDYLFIVARLSNEMTETLWC